MNVLIICVYSLTSQVMQKYNFQIVIFKYVD